jgi:FkbM family methyltransferase
MDVGSFHPIVLSNTCFFYERGWRGVNIDPSREGHALFQEHRPEDLNLQLAISDHDGELTLYEVIGDHSISTLNREIAETYRNRGIEIAERQIPVRTIRTLIDTHGIEPPDILSIDVEGHEAAVIRGTPLDSWRPRALVLEATLPGTTTPSYQEWEPLLLAQGYLFAAFNGLNRFYLREDLRDRLDRFATPVNVFDKFVPHEIVVQQEKFHQTLEKERHAAERERADWQARLAAFEFERAEFERRCSVLKQQNDFMQRKLEASEQQRSVLEQQKDCMQRKLEASEQHRSALEQQKDCMQRQLEASQRQLRPYRLLDCLGVVPVGYRWARMLKARLVS